jgi:hypothetical protein
MCSPNWHARDVVDASARPSEYLRACHPVARRKVVDASARPSEYLRACHPAVIVVIPHFIDLCDSMRKTMFEAVRCRT